MDYDIWFDILYKSWALFLIGGGFVFDIFFGSAFAKDEDYVNFVEPLVNSLKIIFD